MFKRIRVLLPLFPGLVAGLLLTSGCATGDPYFTRTRSEANVYILPQPVAVEKIAVLPFKASTELIGSSVSDMFVTELLRAGRYELVERSQMARVLSEAELAMAGLSSSRAAEVGSMMGADGVIIGTVDEYGTLAQRGRTYPVVGISVRMIECASGKVMWSADLAKRSDDQNQALSAHARVIVHEIVAGIYQKWKVQRKIARSSRPSPAPAEPVSAIREAPQDEVPLVDEQLPPVPADFTLSDMGLREVTVRWGDSTGNPAVYRIERATSPDGPFEEVARIAYRKKEYADRGSRNAPLQDNTVYYYRLTAITEKSTASQPSRVKESMTAPPPEPPASVNAEPSSSRAVRLSWQPSASEGVMKYVVDRAKADDPADIRKLGETEDTSFLDGGTAKSDLADRTEYLYRVTAVNRVGAVGAPSAPARVKTLPPPSPVQGLTADSLQVRCVPLSWRVHPQEDVIGYIVYRSDAADGEFSKIADIKTRAGTRYLDGGKDPGNLADDREYFYIVNAVNEIGVEGDDSAVVKAATRPRPPVVAGLETVSGRPREIPLKWQVSTDEKVVGYAISRASDGDFEEVATVKGMENCEYVDQGGERRRGSSIGTLQDGTTYRYRVLAFNTAGARSEWSEPVEATTKVAPGIPVGLETTTNLPRAVRTTWRLNGEKDIREYVVESSADGRRFRECARVSADEAVLAATENGLRDNEAKFYRLKAVDSDTLESGWCEAVAGRTKPLPDAPSGLAFELTDEGAVVRWSAAPQPDITGYKVWRKGLLSAQELGRAERTEYTVGPAELGKGLTLQVSALDADGLESERSEPLEIKLPR